jgi:predicted CoA-binding protein
MVSRQIIDDFLSCKTLAVVGVSGSRKGFGYTVFKDLRGKGYTVYPVNPKVESIDGDSCYPNISTLPEVVEGIVLVVPPEVSEKVVREAAIAGIKRVWMQQGAESSRAISFCEGAGIAVVHGECIMMFAEPKVFPHNLHRWVHKFIGKLPE